MKNKPCALFCAILIALSISGIMSNTVFAENTSEVTSEVDWESRYYDVLEKYTELLEKYTALLSDTESQNNTSEITENPFNGVQVGDLVAFGRYEQDGDKANGEEAIEWRVLAVEDGKALIISEYALDAKPYNTEFVAITWEGCTLRSWLNDDFYQAIFSEDEQDWIVETQVINEDNPDYKTVGGNDTEDKVFLLSIAEANEYFADDEDRKVYETPCAKDNGTYVNKDISTSWWWLRSPGLNSTYAAAVDVNGWVIACGDYVFFTNGGVRPALWITLES